MTEVICSDLRAAVEGLHACKARFVTSLPVREQFQGTPVWEGDVSQFELTGHPAADTCYAWSEPIKGSDKRRFFAVLKVPPVDSPEAAVRASIVKDYKDADCPDQ